MSKTITGGGVLRATRLAPLVFYLALCACSSAGNTGFLFLADPGKYQYHNCKQLADALTARVAREKELKGLIEKAEAETAGVFVGVIAYRSEYTSVGQEIQTIVATQREKNCPPPPSPAASPARRSDTAIQ